MNITLDTVNAFPFIGGELTDELRTQALSALDTLIKGRGAGGENTGWLHLGEDPCPGEIGRLRKAAAKIRAQSDALVVIGIGGSYLGTRACVEFVHGTYYNHIGKNRPALYFAGNDLSSDTLWDVMRIVENTDFSMNVISKSGSTVETSIAFGLFRDLLEKKYGEKGAAERIFITTGENGGALRKLADEKGYAAFTIPDNVGGRFSVFTPVGLLPLAAADIDPQILLDGFAGAVEVCTEPDMNENPALMYAAVRNALYRSGKSVEVFACFDPAVRYTGEWWKQLFGESEGKDNRGLMPACACYTTDLHSMGQFMQKGARIMSETFIGVENPCHEVPLTRCGDDEFRYMEGKSVSWANQKALAATVAAHTDGGVPNMTVTVPDRSAASFGELCGFFEVSCGISGYLLGVDPFNQPGVEAYKKNMYAMMGRPGYEQQRKRLTDRGIMQ